MSDGELEVRVAWQRHLGRRHDDWFDNVINRYREPHRAYHDVRHVRWVVRHVEQLAARRRPADLDAVVAAAFFHDVIYVPTASNNEAASADLAARALREMAWTDDRIATVTVLIRGTENHDVTDVDADCAVLLAADLAVLAAEPAGYADYVRNVRREYGHVTDHDWATGRAAVLDEFLRRPAIFAAMLDLDEWEHRARANITAELSELRSGRATQA